ncbi:hypothetical protein ACLKA6_010158 [Drosophila palustris]
MNAAKPQPVPQAQHDCSMNASQRSQLPKMRLPKFSGKHSEFRNFMCLFESLVDDDASLTNVEKFNHLVSCLSDEALGVVKPYPLTDCNYPKALASLKSVYDNKCLIFFDTVAQLFDIPSMTKPSASSLRSMIDTVSAIYASLSSLGDEKDISNAMIIHMVMAKVDHVTKSKFEEQLDYDKLPSWEDCAKQLNRRYNTPVQGEAEALQASTSGAYVGHVLNADQVVLATAIVYIKDRFGQLQPARVLLDSGSQINLMSESMAQRLRLKREPTSLAIAMANVLGKCLGNSLVEVR